MMNSFRIGVIGILVEYWGKSMAEGFLHDFEGWLVFMMCTAILLIEVWVLNKIFGGGRSFNEALKIEFPKPAHDKIRTNFKLNTKFITSTVVLGLAVALAQLIEHRTEITPQRKEFSQFPMQFAQWQGTKSKIKNIYLESLKLSDYIMSDFVNDRGEKVNFYVAYYHSQRSGEAAHSPRSCIPGGGWEIRDLSQHEVQGAKHNNKLLVVNRLQTQKSDSRYLVYYWFQQRDRIVTNEYLVKWYLFYDALTRNRTDGALIRLSTRVPPGASWDSADNRLREFSQDVVSRLTEFVPD